MGKSRRATTRTRRQKVVTIEGLEPLKEVVAGHLDAGAHQVLVQKVYREERWDVEASYREWEEI